jgi:transcriptional regulator with XRE-family HTH domain
MVAEGQGERLERLRTEAGLTVYRLAKLSGISRTLIYLIETGRRPLKYDTAKKFAPYINATVEYLLEGIEKESPEQTARKAIAEVEKLLKNVKNAEVEHPSALVTLPLRGGLPCGTPFPEEQQEGENILVPREMLGTAANNADVYALKVKGNSLEGDGSKYGIYGVHNNKATV